MSEFVFDFCIHPGFVERQTVKLGLMHQQLAHEQLTKNLAFRSPALPILFRSLVEFGEVFTVGNNFLPYHGNDTVYQPVLLRAKGKNRSER